MFSWSTTCLCTLALSPDTGSDLVPIASDTESLRGKATPVTSPPVLLQPPGLASCKGSCCDSRVPALHPPGHGFSGLFAIKTFQPVLQRGSVLHFQGFLPVLRVQVGFVGSFVCLFGEGRSDSCWEGKRDVWSTGMQAFLGSFPKIQPSCWPEQLQQA